MNEEKPKKQLIGKDSAISVGLLITFIIASFFVGTLASRVNAVEKKIDATPTIREFDQLKSDVAEIKSDVKELLKKK